MVGSARRLGVVDSGASEVALLVFFAVPMLAFMALVLHSVRRYSAVAAVATTTILTTVLVAVAVSGSPLGLRWGLWLNIAVAVADGLLVVWLVSVIRLTGVVRSRS